MSLTNVKRPGNPLWNCCQSAPAKVVEYDDGSASVTCAPCAFTFERHMGGQRISNLPDDWKPTTTVELAIRMAESVQSYYYSVATSDDHEISGGNSETYKNAHAALLTAYKAAFPALSPERIYEIWLDCNESATYCAGIVAQQVSDVDRNGHRIDRVLPDASEIWLDSGEIVDRETGTDRGSLMVTDFECCNGNHR